MDSNVNPVPRGGKRKNAGRPKVPTPLKKAKRTLNRSLLRSKLRSTVNELIDMLGAGLQNTDDYSTKAQLYLSISKFFGIRTTEYLYAGILSESKQQEASSLDNLDDLYALERDDASDEVCLCLQ